ncbi:MAG: peptidoglycan-binding protein LysM [Saprospiraceae bacterium]|nr:peptidoglycan-binding protein LysM [Saprospiraceae bacterium]
MGVFSFLKNAGAKLFKRKEGKADPATIEAIREENKKAMMGAVDELCLELNDFYIELEDDSVIAFGEANSQADKELVILTLGNTEGIAQVDDRMTVAQPEPEAKFYEVKKGDSLSKIAKAFYGDAMKYPVIFEANTPMLKDPNLIYPGQMLRIPAIDA